MEEIWKDIAGYEGLYRVSNLGSVIKVNHNGAEPKQLNQTKLSHGYCGVCLTKNGKSRQIAVHRLVAGAFIENPENKPQVNHIDGNKKNNHVENLEWVTAHENIQHAIRTGLVNPENVPMWVYLAPKNRKDIYLKCWRECHMVTSRVIEAVIKIVKEQELAKEWINAEEIAPEFPCLVYDAMQNPPYAPHGILTVTDKSGRQFSVDADRAKPFTLGGQQADALIWENRITHWMPIPKPPQ